MLNDERLIVDALNGHARANVDTKSVEVYKNGKLIETITNTNGKLSYTGNEVNVALIAGIATVVASFLFGFNRFLDHLFNLGNPKFRVRIFNEIKQNIKDL